MPFSLQVHMTMRIMSKRVQIWWKVVSVVLVKEKAMAQIEWSLIKRGNQAFGSICPKMLVGENSVNQGMGICVMGFWKGSEYFVLFGSIVQSWHASKCRLFKLFKECPIYLIFKELETGFSKFIADYLDKKYQGVLM